MQDETPPPNLPGISEGADPASPKPGDSAPAKPVFGIADIAKMDPIKVPLLGEVEENPENPIFKHLVEAAKDPSKIPLPEEEKIPGVDLERRVNTPINRATWKWRSKLDAGIKAGILRIEPETDHIIYNGPPEGVTVNLAKITRNDPEIGKPVIIDAGVAIRMENEGRTLAGAFVSAYSHCAKKIWTELLEEAERIANEPDRGDRQVH